MGGWGRHGTAGMKTATHRQEAARETRRKIAEAGLAQCDEKTLTAVRDTLSSDKCKQMRAGLARMDNLKFPEDCKIPQNVRVDISGYCSMFNVVGLETMFDMANKALGVQREDISLGGVDENQTIPEPESLATLGFHDFWVKLILRPKVHFPRVNRGFSAVKVKTR